MVRIYPFPELKPKDFRDAHEGKLLNEFLAQKPSNGQCAARIDAVQDGSRAQAETAFAETANA
ncbi:MAG: hypothetical protein PHO92_01150 [Candidatus Peribacteraceae bacterium]|nr:hypothetical protein [Candidatus Peribacteraceae bacterium]